VTEFK